MPQNYHRHRLLSRVLYFTGLTNSLGRKTYLKLAESQLSKKNAACFLSHATLIYCRFLGRKLVGSVSGIPIHLLSHPYVFLGYVKQIPFTFFSDHLSTWHIYTEANISSFEVNYLWLQHQQNFEGSHLKMALGDNKKDFSTGHIYWRLVCHTIKSMVLNTFIIRDVLSSTLSKREVLTAVSLPSSYTEALALHLRRAYSSLTE